MSNAARPVDRLFASPEILLTVIDHISSIFTLLNFRHTCQNTFYLTTSYQKSISTRLAQSTFPQSRRLLGLWQPSTHTIPWLVNLVPRHLACILVDRHRFVDDPHMFGIAAENPDGDALRTRVANGFRILRNLSAISQAIHNKAPSRSARASSNTITTTDDSRARSQSAPDGSARSRLRSKSFSRLKNIQLRSTPDIAATKHIESYILERRLDYTKTLSMRDREDYQIMSIFIIGAFQHLWGSLNYSRRDEIPDGPLDFGMPPRRWLGRNDSWANWFILHEGPMMFWEQWWGVSRKQGSKRRSAFEKMEEMFRERSSSCEKIMKIERDAAVKVEKELMRGLDPRKYNPPPELEPHNNVQARLQHDGFPDTLGSVPFRMDEKYNMWHSAGSA